MTKPGVFFLIRVPHIEELVTTMKLIFTRCQRNLQIKRLVRLKKNKANKHKTKQNKTKTNKTTKPTDISKSGKFFSHKVAGASKLYPCLKD